jgi:hypothetical protein
VVFYTIPPTGKEITIRSNFSIGEVVKIHKDDHIDVAWWNSKSEKNIFQGWRLYTGAGSKIVKVHKDAVIICRDDLNFWNAVTKKRGRSVQKKLHVSIEAGVHTNRDQRKWHDNAGDEVAIEEEEDDLEELTHTD